MFLLPLDFDIGLWEAQKWPLKFISVRSFFFFQYKVHTKNNSNDLK